MFKTRFISMLVLLMTAVTGAVAQTTYKVSVKEGTEDATSWTIAPAEATTTGVAAGTTVTATYSGTKKVKSVKAVKKAAAGTTVDLSTLTADYEAQDGDVLTGATTSYKVTIAAGATVTLDGVNISSSGYCIKCAGDATIILKDGSTNTLTSTTGGYPALSIGDANTTLTIQGSTGVLNVTSGGYCAGIGGGYKNTNYTCGNIRIEGGVITAQGGRSGAGIGTDCGAATCGDIIITGGTITAKGGGGAAGIGTGDGEFDPAVCGDITIANTVTKVTATKGESAAHSIGKGYGDNATCGTVTIGGNTGAISESPYTYDPSAPAAAKTLAEATLEDIGKIAGKDGKIYATKADAEAVATGNAVAMIAYVGNASDCTHGLAIALADESSTMNWSTAGTTCSSKTATVGTWRLPSEKDWQYMFIGCGSGESYSVPTSGMIKSGSGLASKLTTAQGDALQSVSYWSSSEYDPGTYAWFVNFVGGSSAIFFYNGSESSAYRVRACLAF